MQAATACAGKQGAGSKAAKLGMTRIAAKGNRQKATRHATKGSEFHFQRPRYWIEFLKTTVHTEVKLYTLCSDSPLAHYSEGNRYFAASLLLLRLSSSTCLCIGLAPCTRAHTSNA
ncbi:hypothetical protein GBA52_024594 [Prunus armeniaca]|nr:hypothetical protein GBA52_024594 [Prunus armeniaca]